MNQPTLFTDAAQSLVDLLGAAAPPRDLWTTYGARRFVREWSTARPGSVRELQLLLGLADPEVKVEARTTSDGSVRLLIAWNRWRSTAELVAAGLAPHRLARAARAVVAWWVPFGVRVAFNMTWPGAALLASPPLPPEEPAVTKNNDTLVKLASALTGVHRRAAVPSRTWVSLEAETPISRARHELVFANPHLDRFLVNIAPWHATLRVDRRTARKGGVELRVTALRASPTLELLAPPGGLDELRLDGRVLTPAPLVRAPQLWRCPLAEPLRAGKTYKLTCFGRVEPEQVWVNPVLVEAAKFHARRRLYLPDFWPEPHTEGAFPDLIAGQSGVTGHHQPFRVPASTPAETDSQLLARARRVMLGRRANRRSDLAYLVRELVPGVADAACREAEWADERDGWLKESAGVCVTVQAAAGADAASVRAATERFLRAHLPAALPARVELQQESEA